MIYILDTADLNAIRHANEYYPIDGVTTNPSIIAKEKTDLATLLKSIRDIIGSDKMLHVQTTANKAEHMVLEAQKIKALVGGNFYLKVPIGEEGLKATPMLKKIGIKITMTAIFTQPQALLAAKAGANFVAPYVNRIDNITGDGVKVVSDIVKAFDNYGLDCKVLAASFKNVQQVYDVSLCGCHSVTVQPEILSSLISHPLTDIAVAQFDADWNHCYNGKKVGQML